MVNRLLPYYTPASPPKEGRSHAYPPRVQKWRRSVPLRILVLVIGLAITTFSIQSFLAKDAIIYHRGSSSTDYNPDTLPTRILPEVSNPEKANQLKLNTESTLKSDYDQAPIHQHKLELFPPSLPGAFESRSDGVDRPRIEYHAKLDAALSKVISLLPDEVNIRKLLSQVEGSGRERLREMGLRTRSFKIFFEAWEDLHLVTDGDHSDIRDDVIQFLHSHHDPATLGDTIRSYEAFRSFFNRLSYLLFPWTMPYWSDHITLHAHFRNGGRGLVLSAGDSQAPYILTSIRTFRKLGCTLPIEVMYLGDSDLDEDYRMELESLPGVVTRDMAPMVKDEGWKLAGWAGKPYAILMSSFREVIFIDADSLFFTDPAVLFEDPGYLETGALFFRDRKIMPESKKRWLQQILPKPISRHVKQSYMWTGESGHYQESGVVVVDKWKHLVALLLVTRMNGPDRDSRPDEGIQGIYEMVYGDKETYWLGWELSGDSEYAFHQGPAGIMGSVKRPRKSRKPSRSKGRKEKEDEESQEEHEDVPEDTGSSSIDLDGPPDNYTVCSPQLLHLSTDGKPLWFNGWILANKFEDRKKERYSTFDVYMAEPKKKVGDDDAWKLLTNNECCLTTNQTFKFEEKDRETLNMITSIAKEVEANSEGYQG